MPKRGDIAQPVWIDGSDIAFNGSGSSALYAGTAGLTTAAAAIAGSQAISEVLLQSDPNNTVDILVGTSGTQAIRLRPGQSLVIPVNNLALIFAKAATGTATLNYLGRS